MKIHEHKTNVKRWLLYCERKIVFNSFLRNCSFFAYRIFSIKGNGLIEFLTFCDAAFILKSYFFIIDKN